MFRRLPIRVVFILFASLFFYWQFHTLERKFRPSNDEHLDTYHRRILRYLNEKSIPLLLYEQVKVIDETLQEDIEMKINHLRDSETEELKRIKNGEELAHQCRQTCCWSRRKIRAFYNGEKDRFPTSLDRLSSIDMKLLADVHYGNLPVPDNIQLPKLTEAILPCLQNQTIIFVDSTTIGYFFT